MVANHVRWRALSAVLGALVLDGCSPRQAPPAPVEPAASIAPQPVEAPPAKLPIRKTRSRRPTRPGVDSLALERALVARHAHAPLARALVRRNASPELADRIAEVVVTESRRLRLSPSLVAGVLLVENRQLDTTAVSSAGALGLMQVMPLHAGGWGCESDNLREVEANICHGTRILKRDVRRSSTLTIALRRYNGCVAAASTPRCRRYPARVLTTASRIRRDMLRNV
ncbi:MAG TPA: lytic transglycosylase domain-containing protein [Gemmatimonadales bacterium]|nr:lytic transglycosylase domain-containing protein [Gemmatimonadales bacterium]